MSVKVGAKSYRGTDGKVSDQKEKEEEMKTSERIIREAFDSVLAGVELPPETKSRLFYQFAEAHRNGDQRGEEKAVVGVLANSEWRWKDFEEWLGRFRVHNQWPLTWRPELYEEPPSRPKTMKEALAYMNIKEMKAFLKAEETAVKPAPKKRSEFEGVIAAQCSVEDVINATAPIVEKAVVEFKERREMAKSRLLAHTLAMRAFSIRHKIQCDEINESVGGFRLQALSGGGCPIEDKYAAMFNKGEIQGIPPLFPGDRSCLITEPEST